MTRPLSYAYAIVREDPPALFVAEDLDILHRVLAIHVVAQVPSSRFGDKSDSVKTALLEERWADAVLAWIDATGVAIDVFEDALELYTADDVEGENSGIRMQFTPLFSDQP